MNRNSILKLQEQLTGDLIGLARSTEGNLHYVSSSTHAVMLEGLLCTVPGADVTQEKLEGLIEKVEEEKRKLVPKCFGCGAPCGRTNGFEMEQLWSTEGSQAALRMLLLQGLRCMAGIAHQVLCFGGGDESVSLFFYKALFAVGRDDWSVEDLLSLCQEMREVYLQCSAMLEG